MKPSDSGVWVMFDDGERSYERWGVMNLLGMKIVPHPLAREVRTEFKVTRHATRGKRRKNWRVLRVEINRPGCFQVGNVLYMHPELIAKLPNV